MSKTTEFMQSQITDLVTTLKSFVDDNVFADEIVQDEIDELFERGDLHAFVYQTAELSASSDNKTYSQQLLIYYYSENRTDIDEQIINISNTIESEVKRMRFVRAQKDRVQKKDTDRFVDRVVFLFSRTVPKIGCS